MSHQPQWAVYSAVFLHRRDVLLEVQAAHVRAEQHRFAPRVAGLPVVRGVTEVLSAIAAALNTDIAHAAAARSASPASRSARSFASTSSERGVRLVYGSPGLCG